MLACMVVEDLKFQRGRENGSEDAKICFEEAKNKQNKRHMSATQSSSPLQWEIDNGASLAMPLATVFALLAMLGARPENGPRQEEIAYSGSN